MTLQRTIPKHIAIIMDGNGRWAEKKGSPRALGHRAGLDAVRKIVRHVNHLNIEVLTLYAFSSENWNRPKEEVVVLTSLFNYALNREVKSLHKNNIRLNIIGDISRFSEKLQMLIQKAQKLTEHNTGLVLNIAANYGGRWDIANTCRQIATKVKCDELNIDDINEALIDQVISLNKLPEIDLVIRTGGEYRISNFLLWQIAYAELYFTDVLWPDFNETMLEEAITVFSGRERRFGSVKRQNDMTKEVTC